MVLILQIAAGICVAKLLTVVAGALLIATFGGTK